MNILTIQNLSKSFGKQKVINNLSMSVPEGSVFECTYRLVPREDEPSVCLMHDWIYLPSA